MRRRVPRKVRARLMSVMCVGAVEDGALDEGVVAGEEFEDVAGGDDGAGGGEFADASGEGGVVDEHGDEWGGSFGVGGCCHGAFGHFDEGVVSALGGGAGEVGGGDVVAVEGFGGGPVGVEQFSFEVFEGAADGGVGDGGEVAVGVGDAVEAGVEGEAA